MSASKNFDRVAVAVTALMLVLTLLFVNGEFLGLGVMAHTMGYEDRLFDNTRVHTVDIVMNDWNGFIANAASEEYYTAAVVIDGEAYKNVAIRGKGNTSLSNVASMNSERYSFKIEFDHYDSALTYYGLDKLSLNNLIHDTTMMKDYLTYTLMNEFGASAPLASFVYVTVNGEDWGLYLAVEGVEDSFLTRNYGTDRGELYKPDSMNFGGGRGNGKDFNMDDFMNRNGDGGNGKTNRAPQDSGNDDGGFGNFGGFGGFLPENGGGFDPAAMQDMFNGGVPQIPTDNPGNMPSVPDFSDFGGNMPGRFSENDEPSRNGAGRQPGGFGMGASDVRLQYIDGNADSYSSIWGNAKTDVTEGDKERLIASLKKLSEGEDIDSVVDVEQVIRYFVVHNYVCNGDSYTGTMVHNYYLYEEDGRLSMIPWDYNLAFGTFQGGNGSSTVNMPIDSPVNGGPGEDRPMWYWILSDEGYTEMYHSYFAEFLDTVDVAAVIDRAYELIKPYVEKDPTKFYTIEAFEAGVSTLRSFCELRSQSIALQLENGQTVSNMNYVDATGLTLSDMGSMGGGGGMPGRNNGGGGFGRPAGTANAGTRPGGAPQASGGDSTAGTEGKGPMGGNPSMPSAGFGGAVNPFGGSQRGETPTAMSDGVNNWALIAVSVAVLLAGIIIAKVYRY